MPSTPQTITTRIVFDYLYDPLGKAVPNVRVNVTLNFASASVTSPIVNVDPIQEVATTDTNGYWQLALVPNDTLTPTGTLYTVTTPFNSYDISLPSGGGSVQSSSILANTPSVLSPAATNLTGPITVTGNETVTGNLVVQGTTTLAGTTTGALSSGNQTVSGTETVSGDLTLSSPARLLFGAAAGKIVPGATSISHRNNADNADNLLIADAGLVTVRNGLTVTAGDENLTAGRLLFGSATSKIVPGVTSLSHRNNADSADNLLIADAGLITARNAIRIPPIAGGTLAPTSYGSLPVKLDEVTGSGGSGVFTFSSIPAGYRQLHIKYFGQTTNAAAVGMTMTFNGDVGAHYFSNHQDFSNSTSLNETIGGTAGDCGTMTGTTSANSGEGSIVIFGYAQTAFRIGWTFQAFRLDGGSPSNTHTVVGGGVWTPTSLAAITTIAIFLGAGNWPTGSYASLWGEP